MKKTKKTKKSYRPGLRVRGNSDSKNTKVIKKSYNMEYNINKI